ncbi:hypothetical protein [Fulvivirga lutea]|uniref:Uncharacterized protein n=1 Tax=Fulvivirga lutea TaxID=2810512 RepID=A0A974WNL2_9BACT|nr:hypothetical protein [Fulvivirga lutea]QSE98778.1 hypothetical protein JR347_06785 [Fulvivirga lutea]
MDMRYMGCVDKLSPHLDGDHSIKNWSVDISGENKMLKVTDEEVTDRYVNGILSKEDYQVLGSNIRQQIIH